MKETPLAAGEIVVINGVSIWYRLAGEGLTLIAQCPGWGAGSAFLQRTLTPLEEHFRILYYDTRGSGLSERPKDSTDISIGHMVRDLEALTRHLGITRFSLLGNSHGALISLNYALKYPRHLSSLVLIAPQLGQYEVRADARRNIPKLQNEPKYQAAVREWRAAHSPKTDEEFGGWFKRVFPLYFYDPDIGDSYWGQMQLDVIARETCRAVSASNLRYSVRNRLGKILVPTLVIVGKHDFITSPSQAQVIHEGIIDSEMITLENSGHFPWLEEPEKVFPAIISFLRRHATK